MEIEKIKCTGRCCPSQWEAYTEANNAVYIRYRWGRLTIEMSEPGRTIKDAINNGRLLYAEQLGGGFEGVLEEEAVMKILEGIRL